MQFRADEHMAVCNSVTHSDWNHGHTTAPPSHTDRPHHLDPRGQPIRQCKIKRALHVR
jgi:hypothetical protein